MTFASCFVSLVDTTISLLVEITLVTCVYYDVCCEVQVSLSNDDCFLVDVNDRLGVVTQYGDSLSIAYLFSPGNNDAGCIVNTTPLSNDSRIRFDSLVLPYRLLVNAVLDTGQYHHSLHVALLFTNGRPHPG